MRVLVVFGSLVAVCLAAATTGGLSTGGLTAPGGLNAGYSLGGALGGTGAGGVQIGTAQVGLRDQQSSADHTAQDKVQRSFDSTDGGAGRQDAQERRGDLRETVYNKQDAQKQGSESSQAKSYDTNTDRGAEKSQRQNDVNDKHSVNLDTSGRYDRNDVARNGGDKSLANRKNAFARQNKGFENVDYGFKKDFDTSFNEKGGFKDAVGQENSNSDVYEEKQRDNRFSKGELDAFRRSNDNNAFKKSSDWTSNAAQKQKTNNQYGNADRQQNAAKQQNADWNAILDRKNDVFWHNDNAQDKAVRQANDLAEKRADLNKQALAEAAGSRGVQNQNYFEGGSYGKPTGIAGPPVGYGTSGAVGVSGTGQAPLVGSTGPLLATGNQVGGANPVRGKAESNGGDYNNQQWENARQADLVNNQQSSQAQSDAAARNDYNRGRGVDDSQEVNGQRDGQWAKDRSGLRDANSQGSNVASADVAKAADLSDSAVDQRVSSSNLNAANKNQQALELDRINWKKNKVDQNQNIKKQKQFYHDKNEGGWNNEALNYNKNQGSNDWGEEQQAQKEARSKYGNAAEDAKANQFGRVYDDLDARRISDAKAVARSKDDTGAWQTENRQAVAEATANKAARDNGKQNTEFDSFAQTVNQRNQQLWDQARKDVNKRDRGADKQRSLDGTFAFTPERSADPLGLQSAGASAGAGAGSAGGFGGGRAAFGGSSGFGSDVGSFMTPIGSSQFGQSKFGGGSAGQFGGSAGGLYGEGAGDGALYAPQNQQY